jgi:DNA-binding NtrC family response regulator
MREDLDAGSTVLLDSFDPTPPPAASFELAVVEGPQAGKASFVIDAEVPGVVHIGHSPSCALVLDDPAASRRHASLELVGSRLRIVDLESANGTFVDGVAIVEAYLAGGELVRLGGSALRVVRRDVPQAELPHESAFGRVLGQSTEMRRLYPVFERLARTTVSVLIEGETGTGKELLAEAIHESGPRADGPYVVFDCTAVAPNLVESELFGHEKGAFTGAVGSRRGVFEQAHGGTLLLDEIGDLDAPLQAKLLRVLERGEIKRVGGERTIKVDVRILSATRRDLDRQMQAGRFRDDLFHRLAVARVELPPLRRRRGDVPLIARRFWKELGGEERALSMATLTRWSQHTWPGNVRELRNAVARELALGGLPDHAQPTSEERPAPAADGNIIEEVIGLGMPYSRARAHVLAAFEARYIEQMLARHGGNVMRAAAASGLARRYFQLLRVRSGRE